MVRMEEIQAALYLMMNRSAGLREGLDEAGRRRKEQLERTEGGLREQVLRWFVETQASLLLCDGSFPTWFYGFISRQEAEDHLRDKTLGCFLIRLSEKASGYILSYKGQDRCRHFVINQTKDGMLVVTGDTVTHKSLPQLIEYFTVTPIQPFGECLISEKEAESPSDELYDVVNWKSSVKSGVSVQALRSLWDQRSDVTLMGPPALPPKRDTCNLFSSTSINRNSIVQAMSPVQKKNLPLRNSLSGGHLSHGQSEQKWSSSDLQCYAEHGGHFSKSDGHQSSRSRSLDEDYSHSSQSTNPMLPAPRQEPKVSFSSSPVLFNEQNQPRPSEQSDTNLTALQLNPLYQTSSGLSAGRSSYWVSHGNPQTSRFPEIPGKSLNHAVIIDSTYEDIPAHQQSNTYEDLPTIQPGNHTNQGNNTYEDLPEIQQSKLSAQENNTYEDIPAIHSNTYASVDELQGKQQSSLGKKAHKWWKFKPENKKK